MSLFILSTVYYGNVDVVNGADQNRYSAIWPNPDFSLERRSAALSDYKPDQERDAADEPDDSASIIYTPLVKAAEFCLSCGTASNTNREKILKAKSPKLKFESWRLGLSYSF